jgi:hypothetical protein
MRRHPQIAPEARKPYHPGQFSEIYRNLPPNRRQQIANAVDEIFVKKTGVKRKLDEHSRAPEDRVLVRQWLLIRDAVVSWYLYNKLLEDNRAAGLRHQIEAGLLREQQRERVLQAEIQAGKLRRSLAENVERKLPPKSMVRPRTPYSR